MRHVRFERAFPLRMATRLAIRRLRRDDKGSTAIEFAMVSMPFFMFIFGLIGISMYFFIMTSLDKGMDKVSRLVRTGEAQNQNMTVQDFKNQLCTEAGTWVQCPKVQVFVQKFTDWQSVTPQACIDANGQIVTNNAAGSDLISQSSGQSDEIVLVTTCYKWDLASQIPFIKLGKMSDGSMMMQTATAFRTEPYAAAQNN